MVSGPERTRGDLWAEKLRAQGCWVQKLPASSLPGVPDWLVGKDGGGGTRWVEAKTLEAVRHNGSRPAQACTGAQRFFLDRVHRAGDTASVLVLGSQGYLDIAWEHADVELSPLVWDACMFRYH